MTSPNVETEKSNFTPSTPISPEEVSRPKLDPITIGWQREDIAPWRQKLSERVVAGYGRTIRFLTNRFFWFMNGVNGLLFALAIVGPLAALLGWDWFYQKVFRACHLICAQDHEHSFSLFGFQMPLCERCLAMYGSIFLSGLLFQLSHARPAWFAFDLKSKRFPFWVAVLITLPILIDGATQMFGWRQSSPELRLLTGAIFGAGGVWYLYPQIADRLQGLKKRLARDYA